eukprot:m.95872 g.95872  ORF g.95872 m.95872 type:complete len:1210 (+) comp13520_c0_seq2:277-3906(+)
MMATVNIIPLAHLLDMVVQKAYHELMMLVDMLPSYDDATRKKKLLDFIHMNRGRFMRLLVILKWLPQGEKARVCVDILNDLEKKSSLFTTTADKLYRHCENLQWNWRLPPFAVPCAVDVLSSRGYHRLPGIIEANAPRAPPQGKPVRDALEWLNHQLYIRFLTTTLPDRLDSTKISGGRLWLRKNKLFEMSMTLRDATPNSSWRLLSLDILVSNPCEKTDSGADRVLFQDQLMDIHKVIEDRLASPAIEHPLLYAATCVQFFCFSLRLSIMIDQAVGLMEGKLKGIIEVTFSRNSFLQVHYWGRSSVLRIDLVREMQDSTGGRVKGSDITQPLLRVIHQPPLIDSENEQPADFATLVGNVNVSDLLNYAMRLQSASKIQGLADQIQNISESESTTIKFKMTHDKEDSTVPPFLSLCFPGSFITEDNVSPWDRPHSSTVFFKYLCGKFCCYLGALMPPGIGHLVSINNSGMNEKTDDVQHWESVCSEVGEKLDKAISKETVDGVIKLLGIHAIKLDLQQTAHNLGLCPVKPEYLRQEKSEEAKALIMFQFRKFPQFYIRIELREELIEHYSLLQYSEGKSNLVVDASQLSANLVLNLNHLKRNLKKRKISHSNGGMYEAVSICSSRIPTMLVSQQLVRIGMRFSVDSQACRCFLYGLPSVPGLENVRFHDFVESVQLVCSRKGCRVDVKMSKKFEASSIRTKPKRGPENLIYCKNTHLVQFEYTNINNCVQRFFADWPAACRLFELTNQLPDPNTELAKLWKFPPGFNCRYCFNAFEIEYSDVVGVPQGEQDMEKQYSVVIEWDASLDVYVISFNSFVSHANPHELAKHQFEDEFNGHPDIHELIRSLALTTHIYAKLMFFLKYSNEFQLFARTSCSGRIVYRSCLALDFAIINETTMMMSDGSTKLLEKTSSGKLGAIQSLNEFLLRTDPSIPSVRRHDVTHYKITSSTLDEFCKEAEAAPMTVTPDLSQHCRLHRFLAVQYIRVQLLQSLKDLEEKNSIRIVTKADVGLEFELASGKFYFKIDDAFTYVTFGGTLNGGANAPSEMQKLSDIFNSWVFQNFPVRCCRPRIDSILSLLHTSREVQQEVLQLFSMESSSFKISCDAPEGMTAINQDISGLDLQPPLLVLRGVNGSMIKLALEIIDNDGVNHIVPLTHKFPERKTTYGWGSTTENDTLNTKSEIKDLLKKTDNLTLIAAVQSLLSKLSPNVQ